MLSSQIIISIIVLAAAIPTGMWLAYLTKDEKQIYKKYFPALLWLLAISSAIFYTLNTATALTLTFMFIIVLVWFKGDKILKKLK